MVAKANLSGFPQDIETIYVHERPDMDAFLCLFLAQTYIPQARSAKISFLKKGYPCPHTPNSISFDVGGGPFDHHGIMGGRETCAAILLAKALGIESSSELTALLVLALDADQANEISDTSIHLQLQALNRKYKYPEPETAEWDALCEGVFEMFENVRAHGERRGRKRAEFKSYLAKSRMQIWEKVGDIQTCLLINHTDLRDAAFASGADVVIWTTLNEGKLVAGVQVNRNSRDRVKLRRVAEKLRQAEARIRGIDVSGRNLTYSGKMPPDPVWYLDDSGYFLLGRCENGTPTPTDGYTRLKPWDIVEAVHSGLSWKPAVRN